MTRILRRAEVESKTGLKRSAIYDHIARRKFPRPVKLTEKAVGWREEDIDRWLASRQPSPVGR